MKKIKKKKTNSAYITFSKKEEASFAILSMDSLVIEGHLVRAFFGTSKYCIHFLNNKECKNKEKCMFIHYLVNDNEILGINSKFDYNDHINLAKQILNLANFEFKKFSLNIPNKNVHTFLIKEDISDINTTNSSFRKHSSSSNSSNNSDKNYSTLKHKNLLFKYKNKSRFFDYDDDNIFEQKENEVPETLRNIVDDLFIRFPFFNQFEDLISFKNLAIDYCKEKLKTNNDITLCINNYF
jgi:hypothetical protein